MRLGARVRVGVRVGVRVRVVPAPSARLTSKPLAAAFSRTRAWIDCSSVLDPPWVGVGARVKGEDGGEGCEGGGGR